MYYTIFFLFCIKGRACFSMSSEQSKRDSRFSEDACICCGTKTNCGVCGAWIITTSILLLFAVIGTVLTFTSILKVCTSSADCGAGPGEIATCRGICIIDKMVSYCSTNADCQSTDCHIGTCAADGQCIYTPKQDGYPCNDMSNCTEHDTCISGICRGTQKVSPCKKCVEGHFEVDHSLDGTPCSDNSKCSSHDVCLSGTCVGEPVTCPDRTCHTSECHPVLGCVYTPQSGPTDTNNLCLDFAGCEEGEYSEKFKDCFDGNPCTLDACFPLSGECVHPLSDESCLTVCEEHDDCKTIATDTEYKCWDGMCVDATSSELIIRISSAEVETESCEKPFHGRLQMRFFVDSEVNDGIMHIPIPGSVHSVYPYMQAFDTHSNFIHDGNAVRTYFSMRTVCKNLQTDCYPFINSRYEIEMNRVACTNLDERFCKRDIVSTTNVIAPLNIIDCPYELTQTISLVPTLHVTRGILTVNASLEMTEIDAWITDVVLCIPKENDMAACLTNGDLDCPFRGCYDTPEYYLDFKLTLLSDSNYTAAASTYSNSYKLQLARGYESYAGDRCEDVDTVDWVEFSIAPLLKLFQDRESVLDIKYDVPFCGSEGMGKQRKLAAFSL